MEEALIIVLIILIYVIVVLIAIIIDLKDERMDFALYIRTLKEHPPQMPTVHKLKFTARKLQII